MRRSARFIIDNILRTVSALQVVASNWLCFIAKLSASGLHTNKLFAVDGTRSVPLRLGHCATTESSRYV